MAQHKQHTSACVCVCDAGSVQQVGLSWACSWRETFGHTSRALEP
jgi:hypothetical protein